MKTPKLSKLQRDFARFKGEFAAIAIAEGGALNENWTIGDGAAYFIPTAWGIIRASVHHHAPHSSDRRKGTKVQCVYLSFAGYAGPAEFPLHGPWNDYSHKWNILASAPTLEEARKNALNEFGIRIQLVRETAKGGKIYST